MFGGIYDESGDLVIVDVTNGQSIDDLPLGITEFLIKAQDECGNITEKIIEINVEDNTPPIACLLYTSPSPRDATLSRMPSSA